MNLSENLKKIRKENNLSQEQLAEKLNVSRQSVSKWESGQAYPEMDKVIQICQLFNVSVDDLLNQDIKELNNNKAAKSNINKFIDDVLNYISKTIELFSILKFKEKVKCIFEQLLLVLIFYIISTLILSIFSSFLLHLLSFLPSNICTFIFNILNDIVTLCLCILFIALLFHIFKIRYLNYYVTVNEESKLNDENIIRNDNEENKVKKRERIIIRDPKHTAYNFISSIIKLFIFLLKIFMAVIGLFVCVGFIFFVSCLVISFSIIKTGLLFVGILLILLGIIVLLEQIIMVIFNFINNRKNAVKKIGIILILTLISIGIGLGLIVLSLPKFDYYDADSKQYIETSQEFKINDKTVFVNVCDWSGHIVNFIEEDRDSVLVKVKHYKYNNVIIERYNDENHGESVTGDYVYIYNKTNKFDFKYIKEFIHDINNYKLVDYNKYEIYLYGNKKDLDLIKKRADNYCNVIE